MALSLDVVRPAPRRARLEFDTGDSGDWGQADEPRSDWKKLYLVFGLGALSWVATYVGMLELIEANIGDLPLLHKAIIGFSVAMLMLMIIWLLDRLFAPIGWFTRAIYLAGYLFLSVISVGFGFGFYWKVLESRSEASRSAESAVSQVQNALHAASSRLTQLQGTLDQLKVMSAQKAETERASGASCPNSGPGDGPRRKMRDDDAARFGFASDFVKGRAASVKADMGALDGDLAKIVTADKSTFDAHGTRNEFMRALGRKLELTATGFNAFRTDPQLKQIRADLAERAERTSFTDTRGGTYACPDGQLQAALRGVVRAIDQLPELEKPKIAAVEGSEATIEAFRRLTATVFGLMSFKLPPSADELRELQKKAVQSVEAPAAAQRAAAFEQGGLSKRDYVPLAVAIFVDICLLMVSMGRPMNRLEGLVPKMRAAERGPVYQILSRFSDIHSDSDIRRKFELFRHVVFDFHGDYYVAVPLDAPLDVGSAERRELQLEAHLLGNLFASFEKEKIFSRVLMPLLSTRAIQKKLARQGSKFAGTEGFRIYRFRDGAWSEIILGAVMGAARRVESDKRRRRLEDELFAPPAPVLDHDPPRMDPALDAVPSKDHGPNIEPHRVPDRAAPAARAPAVRASAGSVDPGLVAAFGRYARSAQREVRAADVEDAHDDGPPLPANTNTRPAGGGDEPGIEASDKIVQLSPARHALQGPLPTSEARLPPGFLQAANAPAAAAPSLITRLDDLHATDAREEEDEAGEPGLGADRAHAIARRFSMRGRDE